MTIHETHNDRKGRPISEKIIDYEIATDAKTPPTRSIHTHIDDFFNDLKHHPLDTDPIHRRQLIAGASVGDTDAVRERETITGLDDKGGKVTIVVYDYTHYEEDINRAGLMDRRGVRGFVWTKPGESVELYVAPKGLRARLAAALGR